MTLLGSSPATTTFRLMALLLLSGTALAGDNLLTNGDAEQGTVGEAPPFWRPIGDGGKGETKGRFLFKTVSHGRESAKAIKVDRPAAHEWIAIEQSVPVELAEPHHYRYSVWLRGDRPMPGSADLFIHPLAPAGIGLTLGYAHEMSLDVGTEWTEHTLDFYTPAAFDNDGKPRDIELRLLIQLKKDGPLYIDDVSFERLSVSPQEKAQIESLRKALDAPGVVKAPFSVKGGIIARPDGTLLAFTHDYGLRRSTDGGYTWGAREKLAISDSYHNLSGAIQLRNGDIGIWSESWRKPIYFWKSADGAKTWSERVLMGPTGAPYHGNAMIQLRSGRLVLPVREGRNFHAGVYEPAGAYGTINGKRVKVEGHGHDPEICLCFTHYSDDGGDTWQRSEADVWIWKDNGLGGMWLADEPNIAELKDDRLLMFFRTTLGRIYQSVSDDGGRRWSIPEPTEIPSSISPCSLEAVPANEVTVKTGRAGDLMCVWNNVSRDEVRKGFRRARLCSAISKDDGKTWQHVRTLAAIGVPPLDKMAQLDPPGMTRADKELGELPMPFGIASYPDITFYRDRVLVRYWMIMRKPNLRVGGRLHILPLGWFYGED